MFNQKVNGVTILWALQSPCNLGCLYCYYGTLEDDLNRKQPLDISELSHVGYNDLTLESILKFIETINSKLVNRIFIAGGEPLNWKGAFEVMEELKNKNCEIIICTNGLPLLNENTSKWIIDNKIDAVSISLDSINFEYNDNWRIDKSGRGGQGVINGISKLIQLKKVSKSNIKIGVYCVVSKKNISHILDTCKFLNEIGIDYFIIQPISLTQDHKLYTELSLDETHIPEIKELIRSLLSSNVKIKLPNDKYFKLLVDTLPENSFYNIKGCFGGRDLFFIQPDGSVWDCPSIYKKRNTPQSEYLSILNQSADYIFSDSRRLKNTDCSVMSKNCVNMWQLMSFNEILYA